jgi:queuine tRNA-ribosyltransferase
VFEVVASDSCARVRHLASGEVMHPIDHPDREAERVYVAQSRRIAQALATKPEGAPRPLIVWDVGLGAAHNAMALVRVLDAADQHVPVELVSFERDLDALRLALANLKQFVHLRHAAPNVVNARGRFERPGLSWRLCEGDFAETFARQPPPDVIFWDPFSVKVDRPMWSFALFRALHAHVAARGTMTELFTYSASTALRSSLLAAGFFVARGVASGAKEETTIALTGVDPTAPCPYALLGTEWLARRARSTSRYPTDVAPEVHAELEHAIAQHAQFAMARR